MDTTRQDWQKPDKKIDPNVDLRFTNELGIHYCFGAGIYGSIYNHWEISLSTVFSAEVMAILRCTELHLTKKLMTRRVHICFHSR